MFFYVLKFCFISISVFNLFYKLELTLNSHSCPSNLRILLLQCLKVGLLLKTIQKLQFIQNAAVHVVMRMPWRAHGIFLLHWLPLCFGCHSVCWLWPINPYMCRAWVFWGITYFPWCLPGWSELIGLVHSRFLQLNSVIYEDQGTPA